MTPSPTLRSLALATMVTTLCFAAFSARAATYTFQQSGFTGGGTLSGSFTANDSDGDGWIYGFEVSAFTMSFSGNALIAAFTHTKPYFQGMGFKLGETVIGGHDESYLQTRRTQGGRTIAYDAFGWPEFSIAGRITEEISGTVITTDQMIQVSAVPEPGAWALMLAGGAAVVGVARRRSRA
jgi:hypothetical protein